MTIYVRTQDKLKMFEISSVSYEEKRKTIRNHSANVKEEIIEIRHILMGDTNLIGDYASKDRCLEVMTELQNKIATHNSNTTIVYNMPLD